MLGTLLMGSLASCEMKDELVGTSSSQAMGALELGVLVKESARAGSDEVTTFPVSITSEANPVNNKTFSSYEEIVKQGNVVELPVDEYVVSAHTPGTLEGFSVMTEPYYKGEVSLTVEEGKTEQVTVECKMANTKIKLDLPDDFDSFSSWTVSFDDGKSHTLEFSNTDQFTEHTAYWYLGEEGAATLTMNIVAVKDGITYTDSKTFTKSNADESYENDNVNFVGGDALDVDISVEENPDEPTPEEPVKPELVFSVSVNLTFTNEEESVIIPVTPGAGSSDNEDDSEDTPEEDANKDLPSMVMPANGHITYTLGGNDQPASANVMINAPLGLKSLNVKIIAGNEGFGLIVSDLIDSGLDFTEKGVEMVGNEIIGQVLNSFLQDQDVEAPALGDTSYEFPVGAFFNLMNMYQATAPNAHVFKIVLEDQAGNKIEDELSVTINPAVQE